MNGWKLISTLIPATSCPVWKSQHIVMQNKGQILDWGVLFSFSIKPSVFVSLLPPLLSCFPPFPSLKLWFERMGRTQQLISLPAEIAGGPCGTGSLITVTHWDMSGMDGGKSRSSVLGMRWERFGAPQSSSGLFLGRDPTEDMRKESLQRKGSLLSSSCFAICSGNRAKTWCPSELPQSSPISKFP